MKFNDGEARNASNKREQIRLRRNLQQRQIADFYYLIDVVGTCNLRCPSCAVGNYAEPVAKGLMSLETYQSILKKIAREHPGEKIFIDLYNWGEPGLHKQLSEIIRLSNNYGYRVGISTNLNVFPDMRRVIDANPSYIRISLSGYFNEVYQLTHKRGDINLVKSNMHLLRYYLDEKKSDVIVQVGFHIYQHNFQDDFWKMKQLCEEVGFIFAPTLAVLMPVEKAVKAIAGHSMPNEQAILNNLVVPMKKRAELLSSKGGARLRDCQYRQIRTTINFDCSVPLCCATYEKNQIIADNFLEVSRSEIQARKYKHLFCKICQTRSLDLVFTASEQNLVDKAAVSVLGKKYEEFLRDWNVSLDPVVDWNSQELSAQEAYDLAAKYESTDVNQAIELYQKLIAAFPRHGAALFRLGELYEMRGNFRQSMQFYEAALAVWPTHQPYIDAIQKIISLNSLG